VELSIDISNTLANFYGITIGQIMHHTKAMLAVVTIEDKTANEQARLPNKGFGLSLNKTPKPSDKLTLLL